MNEKKIIFSENKKKKKTQKILAHNIAKYKEMAPEHRSQESGKNWSPFSFKICYFRLN